MDFFETVYKRKTIRKYEKSNPPIDDVKKIIDSARVAPSATNSQNWKFIAIYNDEIKTKMAQAVSDTYDKISSMVDDEEFKKSLSKSKTFSTFFKGAPVVIVCVETKRESTMTEFLKGQGLSYEEILLYRPDSSLLSMGAAIENMSLTAAALGYGTCWMCAPIIAYKDFKDILNLSKSEKIVSLLALGKPASDNQNQPPKKNLDEIIKIIK